MPAAGSRRRKPTLKRRMTAAGPNASVAMTPALSSITASWMSFRPLSLVGHWNTVLISQSLPLPFLVIGGDACRGCGLHVLDAIRLHDRVRVGKRCRACVAEFRFGLFMCGAA